MVGYTVFLVLRTLSKLQPLFLLLPPQPAVLFSLRATGLHLFYSRLLLKCLPFPPRASFYSVPLLCFSS